MSTPSGAHTHPGSGIGAGVIVLGVLGALAIGTGTVTAVATDLTNMIEVALACLVGAVLIVATAVVLVYRKSGRRPGEMPPAMCEQIAAFRAARDAERLSAAQGAQIAAPVHNHLHLHYGTPAPVPVQAITETER